MYWALCIGAVILLLLAAAFICYRFVYSVPEDKKDDAFDIPKIEQIELYKSEIIRMTQNALELPFKQVSIRSNDGVLLNGKYYETSPDAPVQIMLHGYRGVGVRDFCGGLPNALENGFNVLLIDQRAHGKSGGKCLSFGVKERYDCLAWIDYIIERSGTDVKIVLSGISMGAATVLMASGLSLPDNVKGVIADCGYTSPKDIIKKVIRDLHFPVWCTYPMVRLGGMIYGGFDVESASASEAVKHSKVPVLLIHGEDDRFVPCSMSITNYSLCASEKKRLVTVPNAGHGLSYFVNKELYLREVNAFASSLIS